MTNGFVFSPFLLLLLFFCLPGRHMSFMKSDGVLPVTFLNTLTKWE